MLTKRKFTVSIPAELTQYVEELAQQTDRDRSWIISAIIREHFKQHQTKGAVVKPLDRSLAVIQA